MPLKYYNLISRKILYSMMSWADQHPRAIPQVVINALTVYVIKYFTWIQFWLIWNSKNCNFDNLLYVFWIFICFFFSLILAHFKTQGLGKESLDLCMYVRTWNTFRHPLFSHLLSALPESFNDYVDVFMIFQTAWDSWKGRLYSFNGAEIYSTLNILVYD